MGDQYNSGATCGVPLGSCSHKSKKLDILSHKNWWDGIQKWVNLIDIQNVQEGQNIRQYIECSNPYNNNDPTAFPC